MLSRKDGNVYIRDRAKKGWVWVHYATNMDEAVEKYTEELEHKDTLNLTVGISILDINNF